MRYAQWVMVAVLLLAGCAPEVVAVPDCEGDGAPLRRGPRCEIDGVPADGLVTCGGPIGYRITVSSLGGGCGSAAMATDVPMECTTRDTPTCADGSAPVCIEEPPQLDPADPSDPCRRLGAECDAAFPDLPEGAVGVCYFAPGTLELVLTRCEGATC